MNKNWILIMVIIWQGCALPKQPVKTPYETMLFESLEEKWDCTSSREFDTNCKKGDLNCEGYYLLQLTKDNPGFRSSDSLENIGLSIAEQLHEQVLSRNDFPFKCNRITISFECRDSDSHFQSKFFNYKVFDGKLRLVSSMGDEKNSKRNRKCDEEDPKETRQ